MAYFSAQLFRHNYILQLLTKMDFHQYTFNQFSKYSNWFKCVFCLLFKYFNHYCHHQHVLFTFYEYILWINGSIQLKIYKMNEKKITYTQYFYFWKKKQNYWILDNTSKCRTLYRMVSKTTTKQTIGENLYLNDSGPSMAIAYVSRFIVMRIISIVYFVHRFVF